MKSTTLKYLMICMIVIVQACSPAPATEVLHITEPITEVPKTPVIQSQMYTDTNVTIGDGFESKIFDQGAGDDPDMAWARTSPMNPNIIQIAIKRSVLGNPKSYLIGMWAGSSLLDPTLFDVNDYFTYEQAGSADPSFGYYPIKQVAEVDNTCRMAVGYQTGKETGLCSNLFASDDSKGGAGGGVKGDGSDGGESGGGSDGGESGDGSNGGSGGGDPGNGVCPPCPSGQDQRPYPDCTCYSS